jgi:DNA-binding transcriptional MerR regulator
MSRVFTAKEVSRLGSVPLRQIQTWTSAGVLLAIEGSQTPGRGGSRQYQQTEVDLARLLGAIAFHGMSVREVHSIAQYLRSISSALRSNSTKRGVVLLFRDSRGAWHHHLLADKHSLSSLDKLIDRQWCGGYAINLAAVLRAASK